MTPRLAKQILYGVGYLLLIASIVYGAYFIWFRSTPSCSDNRQNQGEAGVDCGGPNCASCALKTLSPLRATLRYFGDTTERTLIIIEIRNPNPDYGAADFSYSMNIFDENNKIARNIIGKSFIYAGETKYLVEPIDAYYRNIGRAEISFSDPIWKTKNEFAQPVLQARDIKTAYPDPQNPQIVVNGFLSNQNAYPLAKTRIIAFLLNQNNIELGASKTEFENIAAFEERQFSVNFPKNLKLIQIATSTPALLKRDLRTSSKGKDVVELEQFLKIQGVFNKEPDEKFDKDSETALAAYQRQIGITPANGLLDKKTRDFVNPLLESALTPKPSLGDVDPEKTRVYVEAVK